MDKDEINGGSVQPDDLTWREQDILILLSERLTNREIANRLHLAESTVKDYVGNIISKLYVKNRREAVEKAKSLGLLEGDGERIEKSPGNLPADLTPFIGRRDELSEIREILQETRLLTLAGPGGIGKTRLGIKTAQDLTKEFSGGCFFVPLAPISDTEHIIQTIAEALRFPLATQEDPQHQLLRYLEKRQLLLVMDNFEHLLDGVGIINEILRSAPNVFILATSRERLNLLRETVYHVGGMSLPKQVGDQDKLNVDAVKLFIQSASKVRPGYDPSDGELEQITEICQIVQGMPLAIELAAAWLLILRLEEIIEEIKKGLDILSTDMRDAPVRHRSLRSVFDYSWSLLEENEQEIFTKLAVFRGGFSREAASRVAGASLQQLSGLVNKSFLNHNPDTGRFEVHELLRQYSQEHLVGFPELLVQSQEAHAAYFADFTQLRWDQLKGSQQMQALVEIEADIENVRAAWRFYLEQRITPQLWKFIFCLWHFYWIRWWNHAGMELFAEAVRKLQGPDDDETEILRALALGFQTYFMAWLDLAEEGYELAKESVVILEKHNHKLSLVFAYDSLGLNAYFLNRFVEEAEVLNKMLEVAIDLDDKWLIAFTMFGTSMVALIMNNFLEARQKAEKGLHLSESSGDVIGSTMLMIILGHVALAQGELENARDHYLLCQKISMEFGFHYSIQTSSKYLGKVTLSLGEYEDAEEYLRQSLLITLDIGFIRDVINLLNEFARLRIARHDPVGAVELLALVRQHPVSYQSRLLEGRVRDSAEDLLKQLEEKLPADVYRKAIKRGQELVLEEVIADVLGSHGRYQ